MRLKKMLTGIVLMMMTTVMLAGCGDPKPEPVEKTKPDAAFCEHVSVLCKTGMADPQIMMSGYPQKDQVYTLTINDDSVTMSPSDAFSDYVKDLVHMDNETYMYLGTLNIVTHDGQNCEVTVQ